MGENGCFPDPTNGALSSDDCNNPNRAAAICERFISINYDEWCYGGFPSLSSLQDQCWDRVQMLEVESGKQKECSAPSPVFPTRLCSPHLSFHTIQFGEDDEEEKDMDAEDAPVLADSYLRARRARCGKYTAGTAAAQAGVNIVNGLWLDSGKDCRYATRQFSERCPECAQCRVSEQLQGHRRCKCLCRDRVVPHHFGLDTNVCCLSYFYSMTPTQVASELARIT